MLLSKCLDSFIYQKKVNGLAESSIENYRVTLDVFVRGVGDCDISDLNYDMVSNYILELYKKQLSKSSVSSYIRNIRIFMRWCQEEYGLGFDAVKIKIPKAPKKVVHIYTDVEIRNIFASIHTSIPWITARNRAIVALMLDSGLRQCEVCNLLVKDIDRERQISKVTGKGSKERIIPIGDISLRMIDDYIMQCPYKNQEHVFLDREGRSISRNAVKQFTYKLQRDMSIQFSSHRLRHNFATNYCIDHVRQNGKTDVYDLSILMGHESIETTKKYEHFAHELLALENRISHLDGVWKSLENP